MDSISSVQHAIDYIEKHLLDNITYEDVARKVGYSAYHFHRLFTMLTGVTVAEYIRNRRLSMAGEEISMNSNAKILDMACKYCYSTQDSFSKAFYRFHGVSPVEAKRGGMRMHLYNRIILKLSVTGGDSLDYRIERIKPFSLIVKKKAFPNEVAGDLNNPEISDFWKECIDNGTLNSLKNMVPVKNTYGVCSHLSDSSTTFEYGIGVLQDENMIQNDFDKWDITHAMWAVFDCIGTEISCIANTWNRIFNEFLVTSEYDMVDDSDFELYPAEHVNNVLCEIWIPIRRKN